jgi:hypothetical protein
VEEVCVTALAFNERSEVEKQMSTESKKYDGAALCVSMIPRSEDGTTKYEWRVSLSASDGHRKLGYRASGMLDSLYVLAPDFPIEVHDADRDVWTTINPRYRWDIRQRIESLLVHAMKTVSESGYWPPRLM